MWYNSAIAFMLVEVNARSFTQMGVMVVIYVLNAIVNAVLFGVFVEQFQVIRKRATDYQEKIDNSNSAMFEVGVSEDLACEVRNYFK